MRMTENDWIRYVDRLSRISRKAAELMQAYIDRHGTDNRHDLISYAYALSAKYGEAAASLTCELYDELSESQNAAVRTASPAQTVTEREVAKAVLGTMKNRDNTVAQTVGRLVKQAGADTALQNALRDGAEFAWVPHGDTCPYCMMLASRGWQKISKAALKNGHAEHIHANCDCEYCVRFDGKSGVEGYDPAKYREIYDNAEGSTPKEKVYNMRKQANYSLTETVENANISSEMSRRRIADDGHEIIDQPTYNKLTRDFVRRGGIVLRDEEAERHLDRLGVEASYINGGNTAIFRRDCTVSAVLEEMYHAEQDRLKTYGETVSREVRVRREIDAQEYLLRCVDKYKIPVSETIQTQKNLENYKLELQQVLDEGKKK